MSKGYENYSYWLETSDDDLTPRPPMVGSDDADVAILGGGFSGLWTAYYLLKHQPGLRVILVEKDICGFGASGRNGGWCTSGFPLGIRLLANKFGREAARDVQLAMYRTVDEVNDVAQAEGLDIDYHKGGSLRVARGAYQVPSIEAAARIYEEFNLVDHVELFDAFQAAERVNIAGVQAALFSRNTAVIHPAKLARGLARIIERLGGEIYEKTEVVSYNGGAYPALHTAQGNVRSKVIVLAGEAYLSRLKSMRRSILPVYSLITLTEPLSPSDWENIGWKARECVSSVRYSVDYLSKTGDGRILFGGRGAPYHFGSSIRDGYDLHGPTHRMLQDNVRSWFPTLRDVKFTHSWGGPLGWPRDYVPAIGFDPRTNIATAYGYTGVGVATANLAGRILSALITGRTTAETELPIVNLQPKKWEPEPFRFAGVRYVQRALVRIDEKSQHTGVAPDGRSLAERLSRH